jgi:hypothetical protein
MEHIHFARIDYITKKVIHITPLLKQTYTNDNGEINFELCNDYLKVTIPDSKNDIWLKIDDVPGKNCGLGYTYDENLQSFIPPKIFDSWILNTETYVWEPPIPEPELTEEQRDGESFYKWNEETQEWELTSS